MKLNENFSFLRFLKATKSMYDSSFFHHIGRAVNKAVNEADAALLVDAKYDDDQSYDDDSSAGSLVTVDDSPFSKIKEGVFSSLFNVCSTSTVEETPTKDQCNPKLPENHLVCGVKDFIRREFFDDESITPAILKEHSRSQGTHESHATHETDSSDFNQ